MEKEKGLNMDKVLTDKKSLEEFEKIYGKIELKSSEKKEDAWYLIWLIRVRFRLCQNKLPSICDKSDIKLTLPNAPCLLELRWSMTCSYSSSSNLTTLKITLTRFY